MENITSQADIPESFCYVCCTDKTMSGWGYAEGKNNRLIFCCDNWDQAAIVADNAKHRGDQIRITACKNKPKLDPRSNFYQVKRKLSGYNSWYRLGYFRDY